MLKISIYYNLKVCGQEHKRLLNQLLHFENCIYTKIQFREFMITYSTFSNLKDGHELKNFGGLLYHKKGIK